MKMPNDCTVGIIFKIFYLYVFFFFCSKYILNYFFNILSCIVYLFMSFRSSCLFSQGQYKSVFKHNIYIN